MDAKPGQKQVSGIVQSESDGLRTREDDGVIPKLKGGEDQCPRSTISYREQILPSSTFCSFQAINTLDDARHTGKGSLLYLVYEFRC